MRTIVDLPTPLFRRAKARAAARGETLRSLLTRAVEAEVGDRGGTESIPAAKARRVQSPLIGTPDGRPKVKLTNADVERILSEEDARHYRLLRRQQTTPSAAESVGGRV